MSNFQTILAIDNDKWAAETYRANFPRVRVECATVAELVEQLPDADVIIAGPPCQPFSTAGEMKGEEDERDCIPDFIAAVKKKRPRMFLMENVRGLITNTHWPYFASVLNELEALGYIVEWKLLDSVSFGVPQFRERVWVWGIRADLGLKHQWPLPTHAWPPPEPCMFGSELKAAVTVGQALGLNGNLHRKRGQGMTERSGGRRDHPTDEPCPAITSAFALGGGGGLFIKSHADPARTIDAPASTLRSGGKGHDGCRVELQYGHGIAETDSPSPTIKAGGNFDADGHQGGGCPPAIQEYRWSDAMLQKHPPASPASPAPTVQAKYFKGGAEGLLMVDSKQKRTRRPVDEPCGTLMYDGRHALRRDGTYIRRLTPLECARLQSVPDDFKWPAKITKTAIYRVVGNGWASKMGKVFSAAFCAVDPQSRTVIDLFCGGGLGAAGWHGRAWEYQA